ncbi:MAG: radical SAM protein [Candidatus Woesearchaeota archaeon]
MNILVLNLPFETPIIRRYSCSYYAKGFLYEPHELLRVATILKNGKNNVFFIDSIAEKRNTKEIVEFIKKNHIDIIVTLLGIDFINEDYNTIKEIKIKSEDLKIVGISYIASIFPEHFKEIDVILDNFFEEKIDSVKELIDKKEFLINLKKAHLNKKNPDIIKKVDRTLLNYKHYHELFVNKKTAFIYFGFGCPFKCNYCIRSYDLNNYFLRKKENIFEELEELFYSGYRHIRILDDNFTINKKFLSELADFLESKKIKFNFYGLSRIDLLDEKSIATLKRLNVKRIYLGLETLNPELQKYYNKNITIDLAHIKNIFDLLHKNKIEIGLWLLYHPLKDNLKDLEDLIEKLIFLNPDYVNMSIITPYPNTEFFKKEKENFIFNINPFYSSFPKTKQNVEFEKKFFIKYFFHPKNLLKHTKLAIMNPTVAQSILFSLIKKEKKLRKDLI